MTFLSVRAPAATVAGLALLLCACNSAAPTSTASGGSQPVVSSRAPSATASPIPSAAAVAEPVGVAVPAGFVPASVTFVSVQQGWVLGTAPCSSSSRCLTLLRTENGGQSWTSVPAPAAAFSSNPNPGGHGAGEVRFADPLDGWVFGPELWATHDGGATWTRISLPGASANAAVVALAAADGMVHAAVFDQRVGIDTTQVGHDDWTASSTSIQFGAGPIPRAQLVLQGGAGWLIEVDRTVVGGARLGAGQWSAWVPPCSNAGGDAIIDASTATSLFAVCNEGVWNGAVPVTRAYLSTDAGSSFARAPATVPVGNADEVAASTPQSAVVAAHTNGGGINQLLVTADGGASWSVVYHGPGTGVANDLGFTTAQQGVVVEVDGASSALLMTVDGGHTWSPVSFH
jgi:photosystem II stability/assembly factor-like uncharacterized protein